MFNATRWLLIVIAYKRVIMKTETETKNPLKRKRNWNVNHTVKTKWKLNQK